MKDKSRVQTCPNLGHFSEEQMCPFGTGTELRRSLSLKPAKHPNHMGQKVLMLS